MSIKQVLSPVVLLCCLVVRAAEPLPPVGKGVPLFDGQTLAGWEGNAKLWRVQDGCLTGGSYEETVPRNEFLASTRDFTNFIIRFQIKLTGTNGFINSGFQMRSQRVPNNSEMAGYQCDYGEPNWYGAIYDESRRDKVMSPSDMKALGPVIKRQDWNDYVIRADGPRVTTWINGVMGTDYTEQDPAIPDWGKLGIQVHGGGKAVVQVRNVMIEELPATPPGKIFRGAPEPKKSAAFNEANRAVLQTTGKAEPVSPEEEKTRFTVAPGFEIELVASEDIEAGIGKFVAIDWDQHGNLWTMTALEYPVDANETPAVAKELYASKAKDKVLVFDRDAKAPTGYASRPRVFADGLAIPLGILPYKNGVYVQHGTEIVFLSDTDGDGKADKREVILSGFGVQDSHLFPHQFTRAPGGWIWMAQGAFNYGKVRDKSGTEVQFDQTRMAKFRPDGANFEITSQGPCNIWGLHMTMEGETWIQEANDYGYPAMPFHEYANYPGCSTAQFKSYAPEFPGTARDFAMGGTGLSGLAMTDAYANDELRMTNDEKGRGVSGNSSFVIRHSSFRSWPEAYCDVIYIANPITRKIQAIKARRDGPRYALAKLPDFIQSSDEMFRPVALRLGPDGCLYFVDWYNKIISHNEVARNHPDRDKKRGRIWRVRPTDFQPLDVPDFTRLSGDELIAKLGGENTTQSHLAWQAIGDRGMKELAPKLKGIVTDKAQSAAKRIAALWALEACGQSDAALAQNLFADTNRNVRREAVRVLGEVGQLAGKLRMDPEPEVRAEVIRAAGRLLAHSGARDELQAMNAIRALINIGDLSSLDAPTMKSTQSGKTIKNGEAYDREFERYLVRLFLEAKPALVALFVKFDSQARPAESTILATLALEPKDSAVALARALPGLSRAPNQEELLRLAQFPDEPGVGEALKKILQQPATRTAAMEELLKIRSRFEVTKLEAIVDESALALWYGDNDAKELAVRVAVAFKLTKLEPLLVGMLGGAQVVGEEQMVRIMRALRDLNSVDAAPLLADYARHSPRLRDDALAALVASRNERAPALAIALWPELTSAQRRSALGSLVATRNGAVNVVASLKTNAISKTELDGATLEKLQVVLGNDPDLAALLADMASFFRPALRLDGNDNAWADTDLTLDGPFTVETWVKLDPGIDNNDGILGAPGVLDMNFYGGQLRVWVGAAGVHDAIIAKKKITADVWTHVAVTRDADGKFRLYQNGELDNDQGRPVKDKFEHLRVAWTAPAKGTAGWLSEFRVWNRPRTADEIRADFDRSFEAVERGSPSRSGNEKGDAPKNSTPSRPGGAAAALESRAPGLVQLFTGTNWGRLQPGAKVVKTSDFPPLLTPAEAQALATKFTKFHALADKAGDTAKGKAIFTTVCMGCHSVAGQGGQVGPVLNGAGANGVESLLRNILTPNAAMEAGYRVFRVELKDGDVLDGIRVSEDKDAIVLRRANTEDLRIPQSGVRKALFTKSSMMPEGLLEALRPEDVSDLFAYLKTLK